MNPFALTIFAGLTCATFLLGQAGVANARPNADKPPSAPAPSAQPQAAAANPAIPFPLAMILIRSSLSALQHADETGNYAVLRSLGSPSFQAGNSPDQLATTFASMRPFNLAGILVSAPKFTQLPAIDAGGKLVMAGFFELEGRRILFSLAYESSGGRWRLFSIGARVVDPPATAGR